MKPVLITVFSLISIFGNGQDVNHLNLDDGVALDGYDAVGYFTTGKAIKGSKSHRVSLDNAVYYFSSAGNKAIFLQMPEKYKPQYGGWCAYAMGEAGEKVAVDPETFKILNGKLYLFYNRFFNNTLTKWNADERNLLPKADAHWNDIIKNKKPAR